MSPAPVKINQLHTFDGHGNAHAAADAERSESLLGLTPLHFIQQGDEDAGTGSADGMADCDGSAVDVDLRGIPTHLIPNRAGLRGEGFIDFQQIKVFDFPSRTLETFVRCGAGPIPMILGSIPAAA